MPEPSVSFPAIYQLRVVLCGVSPLVWRRLLVASDTNLARVRIEDLFGLCYLLGYSFMPRIRDLADQRLYRIDRREVYPT